MQYENDILESLWKKTRIAKGLNPEIFRIDACGALIMRDKYNMDNPFGWEVDHIFPKSLGGNDNIDNLRALHYKNNKSKANDYPSYVACLRFDGKDNVNDIRSLKVNNKVREKLKALYKNA